MMQMKIGWNEELQGVTKQTQQIFLSPLFFIPPHYASK